MNKQIKTRLITLSLPQYYNGMSYRVLWRHEDEIHAGYKDFANMKEAKIYENQISNNLKLNTWMNKQ